MIRGFESFDVASAIQMNVLKFDNVRLRLRRIFLLCRTWRILIDFLFCVNNWLCIRNFKNTDKVNLKGNVLFVYAMGKDTD